MPLTRDQIVRYSLIGLGAIAGIVILRRLTAPKSEDDASLVEVPKALPGTPDIGVDLFTTSYTPAQAAQFRAALPSAAKQYAELFVASGRKHNVSPLVLAGIMHVETNFGAGCKDIVCRGVTGHDYGLMQINDEAHPAFFKLTVNGRPAYQDPASVVDYGAKVLREAMDFFKKPNSSGKYEVSKKNGLKFSCVPGKREDPRPLSGESQLVAGIASYNAGMGNAVQALACGLSADAATHGRKYVREVLEMAKSILAAMNAGTVAQA